MMEKLLKYDYKPNWLSHGQNKRANIAILAQLLKVELNELFEAMETGTYAEMEREAGDIANIACMIIHVVQERNSTVDNNLI